MGISFSVNLSREGSFKVLNTVINDLETRSLGLTKFITDSVKAHKYDLVLEAGIMLGQTLGYLAATYVEAASRAETDHQAIHYGMRAVNLDPSIQMQEEFRIPCTSIVRVHHKDGQLTGVDRYSGEFVFSRPPGYESFRKVLDLARKLYFERDGELLDWMDKFESEGRPLTELIGTFEIEMKLK